MSGAKPVSYGAIGGESRGCADLQTNKALMLSLSKNASDNHIIFFRQTHNV